MKLIRKHFKLLFLLLVLCNVFFGCSNDLDTNDKLNNPGNSLNNEIESDTSSNDTNTKENNSNQDLNESISKEEISSNLSVHFLDVGQGNAILIKSNGHFMLIDGGNRNYSSFVVSYLKKQGVKKLDYIIASHYDADHLNGVVAALNTFDVESVLAPDYRGDSNIYESYLKVMKTKEYEVIHPTLGDTYTLGKSFFTIVSPINYNYEKANDNSIGIKLTLGNNSFLILGDAEEDSEEDMLTSKEDLTADVYLASHHGSRNSSSNDLLDAVNPTYSVISVGNNNYGHPTKETLDRLKSRKVKLYRTDIQGTVVAKSDGKEIAWNVEPTNNWIEGTVNNQTETKYTETKNTESKNNSFADNTLKYNDYYIGNEKTHKFHLISCTGLPDKKNQIILETRQDAINKDYDPCKLCNP